MIPRFHEILVDACFMKLTNVIDDWVKLKKSFIQSQNNYLSRIHIT